MRHCDIQCGDIWLTVQSCDADEANVGMFFGRQSTYYKLDLPGLTRQWRPRSFSPDELSSAQFDAVLIQYRADIMALIGRLNAQEVTA